MLVLNSVGGLGNLLVSLYKQNHPVNINCEMDLSYFGRQQIWQDTEITTFKKNPKQRVLVTADCGLRLVDWKRATASVNMEKGSYELEYCNLELNVRVLMTLTSFSNNSWELVKKLRD